jgi:hypothetical protein
MAKCIELQENNAWNQLNYLQQQEGCEQFVSWTVLVTMEIDVACARTTGFSPMLEGGPKWQSLGTPGSSQQ